MSRASRTCALLALFALAGCGKDEPVGASPPNGHGGTSFTTETLVTDAAGIRHRKGFVVEKLLDLQPTQHGSWISLSFDAQGKHLLAGSENGPLRRIKLADDGKVEGVEIVRGVPGNVHGILPAFDSLYLVSHQAGGLVRCRDVNGDGAYDQQELILILDGTGEHAAHAVILTEDGQGLYLLAGKDCPTTLATEFPSLASPGGWIARFPPDASSFRIVASGMRNAYDLTLNAAGDLFTADSDTEADAGLPWYRPPRFLQVVSGADFGWRSGPEKWPAHYPDVTRPLADLGPSSPAGLVSGHLTHFPSRYRNAIFLLDWTFGAIHAVHLAPTGASYVADPELFLSAKNLPVTDAVVSPDGSLHFITGGRNLPSKLYRVRHLRPTPPSSPQVASNHFRDRRLRLEQLHYAAPSPNALREAWAGIKNPDRFVRYAARIVLERQPIKNWQALFEQETNVRASIQAALTIARKAPVHRRAALAKLANLNFSTLNHENKTDYLRAFFLSSQVTPAPPPELLDLILPKLNAAYPAESDVHNLELSRALAQLKPPGFLYKTLQLLQTRRSQNFRSDPSLLTNNPRYASPFFAFAERPPDTLGLHLAFIASQVGKEHWNQSQMVALAHWLRRTIAQVPPGTKYSDTVRRLSQDFENALPPSVKETLGPRPTSTPAPRTLPKGPGRNWSLNEAISVTNDLSNRNFAAGRQTFQAASCADCHLLAGAGKAHGPPLDSLPQRFARGPLLEAILHPSKTIPAPYANVLVTTKQGATHVGRILSRDAQILTLASNPFAPHLTTQLPVEQIEKEEASTVSPMPPALLNSLNPEELKDLLAYLLSGANPKDPNFYSGN